MAQALGRTLPLVCLPQTAALMSRIVTALPVAARGLGVRTATNAATSEVAVCDGGPITAAVAVG